MSRTTTDDFGRAGRFIDALLAGLGDVDRLRRAEVDEEAHRIGVGATAHADASLELHDLAERRSRDVAVRLPMAPTSVCALDDGRAAGLVGSPDVDARVGVRVGAAP